MKKTLSLILLSAGMAMADPTPAYSVDKNNISQTQHAIGNLGSEGITVAIMMEASKFCNISESVVNLFTIGNETESFTIGAQFDSYYPGINTGLTDADGVDYNQPCAQLFTDTPQADGLEYITLIFSYKVRDPEKQNSADSIIFSLFGWDNNGVRVELDCGVDGFHGAPIYNRTSFTMLALNQEYVTSAEVYNEEVLNGTGTISQNLVHKTLGIPEPTTATLSLLALAALAARRRRI